VRCFAAGQTVWGLRHHCADRNFHGGFQDFASRRGHHLDGLSC
jgi:hypothetical protein